MNNSSHKIDGKMNTNNFSSIRYSLSAIYVAFYNDRCIRRMKADNYGAVAKIANLHSLVIIIMTCRVQTA